MERDFVTTNEISKNADTVSRLDDVIGIKLLPIKEELDPTIAGAIGAGLFAKDLYDEEWKDD